MSDAQYITVIKLYQLKKDMNLSLKELKEVMELLTEIINSEREEEATKAYVTDVIPDPDAPASNPEEEKFVELLKDYDLVAKLSAAIEKKKAEAAETAKEENKEEKE